MAAQRVREILGHHRTAVDRVMQLDRRHNVRGTVVGYPYFQVLMTQIAIRNRIYQIQDGHVMHERRVHHRTDHETPARLWNIRAVLQVVERGVAKRGFHLGDKIVALCQHLQAHVELAGGVGQSEIADGDRVPGSLLQRAEVHLLGCGEDVAQRI